MEFNISQFEAVETAVMDVNNIFGDLMKVNGENVTIELCGPGSKEYVEITTIIERENQARAFAAIRGKQGKDTEVDGRAQTVRKLVACTRVISNNFPLTAQALYSNPKLGYILEQAAKFIEEWANFPNPSMKRFASE